MDTAFIIETGIPVPRSGSGRPAKYPWHTMDPGQSVYISDERANARNSLFHYKSKRPGQQWTTRHEGDGLRVWRLA